MNLALLAKKSAEARRVAEYIYNDHCHPTTFLYYERVLKKHFRLVPAAITDVDIEFARKVLSKDHDLVYMLTAGPGDWHRAQLSVMLDWLGLPKTPGDLLLQRAVLQIWRVGLDEARAKCYADAVLFSERKLAPRVQSCRRAAAILDDVRNKVSLCGGLSRCRLGPDGWWSTDARGEPQVVFGAEEMSEVVELFNRMAVINEAQWLHQRDDATMIEKVVDGIREKMVAWGRLAARHRE